MKKTKQGQPIPTWPRISAVTRQDGTGQLTINGVEHQLAGVDVDQLRNGIIARCAQLAGRLGRPVPLVVTDDDQSMNLAVRPDGVVQQLSAAGTVPDPDGLQPVAGPCRQCGTVQSVAVTECPTCAQEPHRLAEIDSRVLALGLDDSR